MEGRARMECGDGCYSGERGRVGEARGLWVKRDGGVGAH